ncbi:MAG: DUF938 domain-containing protein [bacterium]
MPRDARLRAPATARNRDPILDVLRRVLPTEGLVLEIASGTGEHAVHFARHLLGIVWQPSDPDAESRASIAAWRESEALPNLRAPRELDVRAKTWPIDAADAIVCINMVHISPWTATLALLAGAARVLPSGAPLVLYGPYHVGGNPTAPSNAAFDESLRARNPEWGVRHLEDVERAANAAGFALAETIPMPANNFTLVFRRSGEEPT